MSVARPLPHDAAREHVSGKARYIDDIPTPSNTLHLAFGLSTIAKGTISEMDLSDVIAAKGVVAVLTAKDLPFANDVSPSAHDEPLLATDEVHYVGQPVFMVIATSHTHARHAARLAKVTYSKTTPILTIEEALEADSRFEEGPRIYTSGDPQTALTSAPNRLQGSVDLGGQEHFYLEGQAALALPQEDAEMVIHSSTQHPTEIQHKVAEALGVAMHDVRVEVRRMGGGFGGKESQGNALACACAIAARLTGRPCKMRYDRDDDMIITGKRHDFRITYDVAFDDTGRISAVDFIHYARCGWAQDLSLPVADRAMLHADNGYHIPHMRIESHRLKTNTQSATAFRGFGGPQGVFGIEYVLDHVARATGLDPLIVRQRNFYHDSTPATATQSTHYGQKVDDFCLNALTDKVLASADYTTRRAEISQWNATSPILKRGIAYSPVKFGISFTLTHLNQAGALVHVYQDGSIRMNHGGTEMGQGLFQKTAQVAACRFGVPVSQVKITATDTAKVPNTSATAASSGSDLNGMAVQAACDTIRSNMSGFLATHFGTTKDQIRFENGQVLIGHDNTMSFQDAAKLCYENRISLSSTGFYKTPDIEWDRIKGQGRPFYYFAYGAAITEVVIDTLTGEYKILRADLLHDAGNSLNPALDIGQVQGAYVQGSGWLTSEELVWDDAGRLRTHAPSTYKIPATADRPKVFNTALFENENQQATIYRSKAVGEPPFMLGISTFLAISDAIANAGVGVPMLTAPATPENVLLALTQG